MFGEAGLTGFKATSLDKGVVPCFVVETVDVDGVDTIRASVLDPAGGIVPCFLVDSQNLADGQQVRAVVAPDADFEISVIDAPTYKLDGGKLVEVEQTVVVEPA